MKSLGFQFMPQIRRKKIPPQRRHGLINPLVFPRVIDPEVLVSIDVHECGLNLVLCFLDDGTFFHESAEMLIQALRKYIARMLRSDKMSRINNPGERWPSQRVL
jgi:hypothetical protein